MSRSDRSPLLALAAGQHGAVSRSQARSLGFSRRGVDHLVGSGNWTAVTDEVLRRTGSPRTTAQHLMEAVLDAGPGAVLSHLSAGRWWGLAGCPILPVHVVTARTTSRRGALARVHRVRDLPHEWTATLRNVPVVRPELLALQLFAACSTGRAERLTDRLWSARVLSGPSLQAFVDGYGRRGRNGTAGVRTYLDRRGPGYVPPASGLESRFMELMAEAGIPMRRQVDSGGDDGWTGRVDFRHERLPLVVEIQSERYHLALCDAEADGERVRALRAAGLSVLEITDTMVFSTPRDTVAAVRAAIAHLSP